MAAMKSANEWMEERNIGVDDLAESAAVERKVLDAILHGRYTPSPQQRRRVAAALGVEPEEVRWGHTNPVEHLYGHGPQFGRTP